MCSGINYTITQTLHVKHILRKREIRVIRAYNINMQLGKHV